MLIRALTPEARDRFGSLATIQVDSSPMSALHCITDTL